MSEHPNPCKHGVSNPCLKPPKHESCDMRNALTNPQSYCGELYTIMNCYRSFRLKTYVRPFDLEIRTAEEKPPYLTVYPIHQQRSERYLLLPTCETARDRYLKVGMLAVSPAKHLINMQRLECMGRSPTTAPQRITTSSGYSRAATTLLASSRASLRRFALSVDSLTLTSSEADWRYCKSVGDSRGGCETC